MVHEENPMATTQQKQVTQEVQQLLAASSYRLSPQDMLPFVDLTSLGPDDDEQTVDSLCQQAQQSGVAGVCVYPQFAPYCKQHYPQISLAVVGQNFPGPSAPISLDETLQALEAGACEVDMVVNLELVRAGQTRQAQDEIGHLAGQCHGRGAHLKVILESGEIEDMGLISTLSQLSIEAGADFIKTSTGKTALGATLEACLLMLQSIQQSGRPVGLKPSGGIRTYEDALPYFQLAHALLGDQAICPQRFRLGASGLVRALLEM